MKVKGGSFRNLEDVLQKLSEDSPFFVKVNKLTVSGLKLHDDGSVEITQRVPLKWAGMSGLKGTRGVNIKSELKSYFRQDDQEDVYYENYFLADYRVNADAPALPKREPKTSQPEPPKTLANDTSKVRVMLGKPDFESAVETLVAFVSKLEMAEAKRWTRELKPIRVEVGKRYVRIFIKSHTWCFIDMDNGDILKPASIKAPAKHARGNVYDQDSWSGFTHFGPQYLR